MYSMQPPKQLDSNWSEILKKEWDKQYLSRLSAFLAQERASSTPIYPSQENVFRALNLVSFVSTQVVIIGQDPYHGPGQAHGLSFSVPRGVAVPPSLKNIFKELVDDLKIPMPTHGNLESWAKQGILMLNNVLTVRENQPKSHYGKGWELFTDAVVAALNSREDPIIFVLWGKPAQEKCSFITSPHFVLKASHPSPYSAYHGFFGCKHFSKINKLLTSQGKKPINWELT